MRARNAGSGLSATRERPAATSTTFSMVSCAPPTWTAGLAVAEDLGPISAVLLQILRPFGAFWANSGTARTVKSAGGQWVPKPEPKEDARAATVRLWCG